MKPEKFFEVLKHEGVTAIATQGPKGPHLVNTWNSYIEVTPEESLLIPAGYMNKTEENIKNDSRILLTVGSREVAGFHGPGTGFLIQGTASFLNEGPKYEKLKQKFPWARAALEVHAETITQTL